MRNREGYHRDLGILADCVAITPDDARRRGLVRTGNPQMPTSILAVQIDRVAANYRIPSADARREFAPILFRALRAARSA